MKYPSIAFLLFSHCTRMSLYSRVYYIHFTIDDTVIVHHGETCSVRLFVLFRETVFSPVPPSLSQSPPQHRSRCVARGPRGKKNEISIKENDKSVYYLDVMRDNSIIFLPVRIRRNPRRYSYCTS
jgi:hypothetical protein